MDDLFGFLPWSAVIGLEGTARCFHRWMDRNGRAAPPLQIRAGPKLFNAEQLEVRLQLMPPPRLADFLHEADYGKERYHTLLKTGFPIIHGVFGSPLPRTTAER
eukprot:gene11654-57388_t